MTQRPPTLFVGNVPPRTERRDLEELFGKYGRVNGVAIRQDARGGPNLYAFVEFTDPKDAENARAALDGHDMGDLRLRVDVSKPKSDQNARDSGMRDSGMGRAGPPPSNRMSDFPPGKPEARPECTIIVENLPDRASWQDLKDFARKAGEPMRSNVSDGRHGKVGEVVYREPEHAVNAIRMLDDSLFCSRDGEERTVRVSAPRGGASAGGAGYYGGAGGGGGYREAYRDGGGGGYREGGYSGGGGARYEGGAEKGRHGDDRYPRREPSPYRGEPSRGGGGGGYPGDRGGGGYPGDRGGGGGGYPDRAPPPERYAPTDRGYADRGGYPERGGYREPPGGGYRGEPPRGSGGGGFPGDRGGGYGGGPPGAGGDYRGASSGAGYARGRSRSRSRERGGQRMGGGGYGGPPGGGGRY